MHTLVRIAVSSRSRLRLYGTGWPKPSPREPVQPYEVEAVDDRLKRTPLPDEDAEKVRSLEGWLFGKKVIYLNRDKPYYMQIPSNQQYLFGERPLPPGYRRLMQDWEIMFLSMIASLVIVTFIVWWGKPETSMYVWGKEELRERRILAKLAEDKARAGASNSH